MLDQNIDRFWFLIGTVLVSAALFVGVEMFYPGGTNGVFELFSAAVSDTDAEKEESYSAYTDFTVVSSGFTSPNPISGATGDSNIYDVEGNSVQLNTGNRGLELYVFNAQDEVEFHDVYDVYGNRNVETERMANKLNSITDSSKLIVVLASDSITYGNDDYHMNGGLDQALYAKGASEEVYSSIGYRETYIFVGKPGMREGDGFELVGDATTPLKVTMPMYSGWTPLLDETYVAEMGGE